MMNNILDYFLNSITSNPSNACIQTADCSFSYEQVFRRSMLICDELSNYRNTPIVILIPKSPDVITSIVGITASGNIYVPVDVNAPVDRLQKIVLSLESCVILFDDSTLSLCEKITSTINVATVNLSHLTCRENHTLSTLVEKAYANILDVIDTDPAYIIFTSGSTGVPKGVTICHRSIIDYISWANSVYKISSNDIVGSQAPFYFDNSTLDLYLTFSNSASLNLIPDSMYVFPAKLLEYVNEKGITTVFWVPSILVNIANLDLLQTIKVPNLRNVLFAGEVMPAKQLKYWLQHHPTALYSNLYGPTEITVDCTYFNIPDGWDGDEVPIGIPCRNTSVLILDEDDKESDVGELCVRGSSLALGYWSDAEKTDKVFIQNPLHNKYKDLIYRTGDIVRRSNGLIYFSGRKDFQIKHNGYRIELGEIETVVSNLACVASCVSGYLPQKKMIYLCVVASQNVSLSEFRKLLVDKLPKYMIPTKVLFFDDFPMTPNGKVNRLALQAKLINED